MRNMKIGENFTIHCYKHDGHVYNSYEHSVLLDVKKDYIVVGNNKVRVTEEDGRVWYTKEPAVIYYYKNKWYNVIVQFKKNDIYYYCNIATPTIIEGKVIKYIDYDLDLRGFPDGSYKILDKAEYEYHKKKMNYPKEIDIIVKQELKNLIKLYESKTGPFDMETAKKYYEKYNILLSNKNQNTSYN